MIEFLRAHPLIPLFLTLGLGFLVGKLRIGSFTLGPVAATLIVGVAVGQLQIAVPDLLKTTFFLFFLFSIGYSVGPQFFRSFRGPGLRMVAFALTLALVCAGLVIVAARLMGYSPAVASGLYAGSQTVAASLGVLADTVRELPYEAAERDRMLLLIPACYAVTYVFGTVGSAWYLSAVGPALLGGIDRVRADVARMEEEMDRAATPAPGIIPALRPVIFRAYRVEDPWYATPRTVADILARYAAAGLTLRVERVRTPSGIVTARPGLAVAQGDTIVLGGRSGELAGLTDTPGPEVADQELLSFGAERTPVTVSAGPVDGLTVAGLRDRPEMARVIIASVRRAGQSIPLRGATELQAGDIVTVVGRPSDVEAAAQLIGYADRDTDATDMVFVGLGIAAGCVAGSLSVRIGGIPMALGASVGALFAGLILGWLRTRRPTFGHIPSSALWVMNNLGVNMFIACLGLSAGGALLQGLHEAGWWIIAVGAVLTLLTLTVGLLLGRWVFRFRSPVTLGCVAGSRCSVAAIGAVLQTLRSDVPNLGYTVTYATANVTLVFASLLVLLLV